MTKQKVGASLLTFFLLATAGSARAGERQDKFPVSESQLKSLGIAVVAVRADAEAVTLSLPAQVKLPTGAEHIVSAPLGGMVTQLLVQPNDAVKAGAPLLRIVSPELGTLQLQLMQAASRHGLVRALAKREQALFDEGIIARRRVEEANAALAEVDASLRQSRAALRLAGMSPAAIARVAGGGQPEDGMTLTASRAGIVTGIDVKAGQRVEPATPLMQLTHAGSTILEIQAPAAEAAAWKVGNKVQVQGRNATARVASVGSMVNGASQTVLIRADVAAGADVRPGEMLTVLQPLSAGKDSFDLPLSAVVHDGQATVVFVRTASGFEARTVRVLQSAGQRVRLGGALKAGDKVAVSGVVALKGSWLGEKGGE